jgi:hypothetical protein
MIKDKKSPCYDKLKRHIDNEFVKLQEQHIEKWSFFKDFGIDDAYPDGKLINTGGFVYDSTITQIFWSSKYIPGYIEQIFDSCLDIASKSSEEFNIHPNKCYKELENLFFPRIPETYKKMAEIDSLLRGNGIMIPQQIDTGRYVNKLQDKIKVRLDFYRLGVFRSLFWWLLWPISLIKLIFFGN